MAAYARRLRDAPGPEEVVPVRSHLRTSFLGVPHPVKHHFRRQPWGSRVRYNPEVAYHLTHVDNVERILHEGLRPGHGENFPGLEHRAQGRVFLVPRAYDLDRVLSYMPNNNDLVILAVDTHGIPLYEGSNYNLYVSPEGKFHAERPGMGVAEYFTTTAIPPERIRVVGSAHRVDALNW